MRHEEEYISCIAEEKRFLYGKEYYQFRYDRWNIALYFRISHYMH